VAGRVCEYRHEPVRHRVRGLRRVGVSQDVWTQGIRGRSPTSGCGLYWSSNNLK
jgi:hypothetical protein